MTPIKHPDDPLRDLYPTAQAAYQAGIKSAAREWLIRARNEASTVSGKYETASDPAKFHCAQEICGRITRLLETLNDELASRTETKQ